MNVLCWMKAAGALASAVPRSIGPRRYTQGRFQEALGGLGPRRTSAPVLAAAIPMQAADVRVYVPKMDQTTSPVKSPFVLRGGILSGMATIDFAEAVRRRLAERGQSQYRAAVNSGLPQDAIRSVLNGTSLA